MPRLPRFLRELKRRWDQASLEYDLTHGRRAYGRSNPAGGGGLVEAEVPMHATIEAVVIRADGSREDLGVVSESDATINGEQLARLHWIGTEGKR